VFVLATALAAMGCASRRDHVVEHKPAPVAIVAPSPVASVVPKPVMPREPFTLRDDRERAIEVYPPVSAEPRAPLVVFLHATCMQPASVCDAFGTAARDPGWLVCPSGNSTCYGEPDWHGPGPEKAAFLASALAKVDERIATFVDARPGVLIGWSRGAFAARDILDASHEPLAGRFRGLVLIAAHVMPPAAKLKKAGIERVVMAAGDYDGARPTMTKAIETLRASGLEARYVSLGKIGHAWPSDFDARMREPIAWASGQ
jgi:predicted esterase